MGLILSSKRASDKVIVEALLEHNELAQLKGELDDIHIFSEKTACSEANIVRRGKNDATTYFLVPRSLRKDISVSEPVLCQRIDTKQKAIFVYVLEKDQFQGYQRARPNSTAKEIEIQQWQ